MGLFPNGSNISTSPGVVEDALSFYRDRDVLESVVKPEQRVRMGDALVELGRRLGLTNDDLAALDQVRDKAPVEPMRF